MGVYSIIKLPYGALVLFVDKKDSKLKICIDYHALIKIMIKKQQSFAPH
jgi:hypothetical protein